MSEKNKKPKLIIILGPTASGKSDIAVSLAKKINGEIISADSRQVYKGLNIGTGKITKKEMRGVRHYLLDVVSLNQLKKGQAKQFSVSDFVMATNKTIIQIVAKGKVPIICGGTGFYIDALLGEKQIPEVPANLKLRKGLGTKNTEKLFEILKRLDPRRVKNIDPKNPRRLIRAIEICEAFGKVPKSEAKSRKLEARKYKVLKIGIKIPNDKLRKRINKRINKWFKQGLLEEVQNLHKKGLSWRRMSEIGLEYKLISNFLRSHLREMLTGTIPDTTIIKRKMEEKTWQYAKRQMTWFNRDKEINWFGSGEIKKIKKQTANFI